MKPALEYWKRSPGGRYGGRSPNSGRKSAGRSKAYEGRSRHRSA